MLDNRTSYIITSGNYSDYHIVAVFMDKQKAEHFLWCYNRTHSRYSQADIETWEISDDAIDVNRKEILVEYRPDFSHAISYDVGEDGVKRVDRDSIVWREYPRNHRCSGQYEVFQFMLDIGGDEYSIDSDKLDKIARDRYAAFKAMDAGL